MGSFLVLYSVLSVPGIYFFCVSTVPCVVTMALSSFKAYAILTPKYVQTDGQ